MVKGEGVSDQTYHYNILWSKDDAEYVGTCTEFPSLSWLAQTPEEALKGIRAVVAAAVADLEKENAKPKMIARKKLLTGVEMDIDLIKLQTPDGNPYCHKGIAGCYCAVGRPEDDICLECKD